jgi:glycosyltransferase involved in cell wall biosynthesis
LSRLKRQIFRQLKANTNYWIVQTSNTKSELISNLSENADKVLIYPFYEIKGLPTGPSLRTGYIYASNYVKQKNFEFVVEAWLQMALQGKTPTLHLTLSNAPEQLIAAIKAANAKGTNIINHGFLSHKELFDLYGKTKAIVYAATNESLGLCLIEAMENGCDVIAPDLPYVHSICKPSETFVLNSLKSFTQAIQRYEKESKRSILLVENKLEELISLIH